MIKNPVTFADVWNHPIKPFSWQIFSRREAFLWHTLVSSHLLASRTAGIGRPFFCSTWQSSSCFQFRAPSNVDPFVMSYTTNAPLDPLKYTRFSPLTCSWPNEQQQKTNDLKKEKKKRKYGPNSLLGKQKLISLHAFRISWHVFLAWCFIFNKYEYENETVQWNG